jgi:DNA excision repair protein ERCC-2
VLRLSFSWSSFVEALDRIAEAGDAPEFFTTFHPHPAGGIVRITCCDASAMLQDCYEAYEQVVAFSATLKPFEYYARLSGLDPDRVRTEEFLSPFPAKHRKVLIIPQVSTKFADREQNYARIADAVERIAALRQGNYFVFFPSFGFLERVFGLFRPPAGFTVLRQERETGLAAVEAILGQLRQGPPTILFAVQGGVFAEGVDYPGEMAIGAFVVGPPLQTYDLERELMRAYYERTYRAGFDYAYVLPAMAKAVQAAGRVIRSEQDRGLIVLLDNRFVQPGFSRAMPRDWFAASPQELVSDSILRDVAAFWADAGEERSR